MMWFQIVREGPKSLTQQIYEKLRSYILNGELQEGEKVPSTRELSASLQVSRNITLEVYDQLASEGYLEVRPKSGTYIAAGAAFLRPEMAHRRKEKEKVNDALENMIDFKASTPAMDHFPRKVWGKLAKDVCLDADEQAFGYLDSSGLQELREELSRYLFHTRGVNCTADNIVITSGATQGLSLITGLLVKNKQSIAVEDPVTDEMRNIFTYHGAVLDPIPVDEKGLKPEHLPEDEPPGFIFTLPSHQFPLGSTLTIQRRIQLIEYARKHSTYIVEDDYDSEFTYEGSQVHSIQGLDPERVIYVGTFSKILSPGLRIGYAVLPADLRADFKKLKWYSDRHHSGIEQLILARFLKDGHFDKHIRKMKRIYRQRRQALVDSLKEHFPDCRIWGHAAGMHLVAEFPSTVFEGELLEWIFSHSVRVYPVEQYSIIKGNHKNKIVLGYGSLTPDRIEEGIARLKKAIRSFPEK
ncbi:MocR-like pyridoxine biosynthesis transcription factor PdxR [Bacillus infantis]|uniref:MocR-like pyridoxine biosynthesis transcription factor PdxR n=1 Tax=Bacillus infantis TaxID=324767 RepID=UPI003850D07E